MERDTEAWSGGHSLARNGVGKGPDREVAKRKRVKLREIERERKREREKERREERSQK